MCFQAVRKNSDVAEKIIYAYKRFNKPRRGVFESPIMDTIWKIGKTYTEEKFQKRANLKHEVHRGFHCYRDLDSARNNAYTDEVVVKVAIPKGSLYHMNDWQYCANKMVIVDGRNLILKKRFTVKKKK